MVKRYAMVRISDNVVENVSLLDKEANDAKATPWKPPAGIILVESDSADPEDVFDGAKFTRAVQAKLITAPDISSLEKAIFGMLGIDLVNDFAKSYPSFFKALENGLIDDANKLLSDAVKDGILSVRDIDDILALEAHYGVSAGKD